MDTTKMDHVVTAAKELGESFKDSAELISGINGAVHEANQLYDHGGGGTGKALMSFGFTLIMIPEPFMVSDVVGAGIVAAGYMYNKVVPPPIYIDNVFDTIQEQVKAIHSAGGDLTENYSPNVDFSSFRFNI